MEGSATQSCHRPSSGSDVQDTFSFLGGWGTEKKPLIGFLVRRGGTEPSPASWICPACFQAALPAPISADRARK